MLVFPTDRESFIHLQRLAGLYAAATQDTLVGVIPIEWVGIVDRVRFGTIRYLLMFDSQQFRRVMNRAVAVIVVAHRTVEKVVPKNAVERFSSSGFCLRRTGDNLHPGRDAGPASASELAVYFHQACIAGLDRAELWVVAHLRNFSPGSIDDID